MNNKVEKYLKTFSGKLHGISNQEKESTVMEIENHIYEAINQQESVDSVLNRLGQPEKLATAYTVEYKLSNNTAKPSMMFDKLLLGMSGIVGMLLIPTLLYISIVFLFLGVATTGLAITNFVGLTNIPMMIINPDYQLTGFVQLIAAFVVTIILISLSFVFFKFLQKYCKHVSGRYYRIRLNS